MTPITPEERAALVRAHKQSYPKAPHPSDDACDRFARFAHAAVPKLLAEVDELRTRTETPSRKAIEDTLNLYFEQCEKIEDLELKFREFCDAEDEEKTEFKAENQRLLENVRRLREERDYAQFWGTVRGWVPVGILDLQQVPETVEEMSDTEFDAWLKKQGY